MELAVQLGKPLIVHTRDAEEDTYELMTKMLPKDHKIHVHCFTGTIPFAKKLMDHFDNLWFGFTGAITFKSAVKNRETVKFVPLERILLETGRILD
jgi:TatD DNase family protein